MSEDHLFRDLPKLGGSDPYDPDGILARRAVELGILSRDQLDQCLREQAARRGRGEIAALGLVLLEMQLLSDEEYSRFIQAAQSLVETPSLQRYPIHSRLGEGTSAVVYRAWDRGLQRPVALKILRERQGASELQKERFRREARAAGGLVHPNLITVFDAGEEEGRLYLVMELVEGKSLSQFWQEATREPRQRILLLEKVARAVAVAHAKGIVHRDLKPQNILVGQSGEPKVGDFGLAHLIDSNSELTRTGATLGTPIYMAPEQVAGRPREVSPRTDVYALGALLYEGLTGRPPHSGETLMELYGKITRDEPMAPRRVDRKISPELEAVALKALDKNPQRRYTDAAAFADDLERFLSGEAVQARKLPGILRLWRRARKYHASILVAALVGLGIASTWSIHQVLRSQSVELALEKSREAENAGRTVQARDGYGSVLALDPDNAEARSGFDRADRQWRREQQELSEKVNHQEAELRVLKALGLESCRGEVSIVVGKKRAPAVGGQELRASHGVETGEGSGAVVRYQDSSRVELGPKTLVTKFRTGSTTFLSPSEEGKEVVLATGSVTVEVVPQPADRPLVLKSPAIEIRTVEGRLSMEIRPGSTQVEVRKGALDLKRMSDGWTAHLAAGETLNVTDDP